MTVKPPGAPVPTQLHLMEDGKVRRNGARIEHLELRARVVPIVSAYAPFLGGGTQFGLSFQAEKMIITPGSARDVLDDYVTSNRSRWPTTPRRPARRGGARHRELEDDYAAMSGIFGWAWGQLTHTPPPPTRPFKKMSSTSEMVCLGAGAAALALLVCRRPSAAMYQEGSECSAYRAEVEAGTPRSSPRSGRMTTSAPFGLLGQVEDEFDDWRRISTSPTMARTGLLAKVPSISKHIPKTSFGWWERPFDFE